MWWRTWTVLRAYFSSSPKNVNPVYTPTVTGWTGRTSKHPLSYSATSRPKGRPFQLVPDLPVLTESLYDYRHRSVSPLTRRSRYPYSHPVRVADSRTSSMG